MSSLGYAQAFQDNAGNAIGVLGDGPRQIILLGHIDTVKGEIPLRIDGDRLYGRGAVDAKGPLAAFVDAAAAAGAPPGWQIVVIGAVDEEGESAGARFVVDRYHPDFAIIGEPSRWDRVTLGYKGSARAALRVELPLAHTAAPTETASEAAVRLWQSLLTWTSGFNHDRERLFDQVSPSLLGVSSGGDGFLEWAQLSVSTRLPPGFSPDEWYGTLSRLAAGASVSPLGFPLPAYKAGKNTPLVRAFLSAIRKSQGNPGFVLKTGTADLNLVAPAWGCPAVAYGPGDSSLDHTPSEHILLSEYAQSVSVLQSVLLALAQ